MSSPSATDLWVASSSPDYYALSGPWLVKEGNGFGCNCANCGRGLSAPFGYERALICCIYCGLHRGLLPLIEIEPHQTASMFGITREEAAALRAPNFIGRPDQ